MAMLAAMPPVVIPLSVFTLHI
uniref:Uncharacterized protein n=1 Tax=Anguilla anguilla TaxID=7936 RepID=A0A0E9UJY5_ANGAN